jgi:hypothetical protein
MRRKGFALVVACAVLLAAAVPAFGGVGDVIGSFRMDGARNIYRDANFVYCVVGANTLRRYTVSGSLVGTVTLSGLTTAGDADHSPLGPGHLGVIEASNRVYHYRIPTGSFVTSMPTGPTTLGYAYFPGRPYFYVHVGTYVNRYTTTGSFVGSFMVGYSSTAIAATDCFDDMGGDYVIVASRSVGTMVFTGTGSFVRSFNVPGGPAGCVCGPGTPYTPKTTYWCNIPAGANSLAYEIDPGNKNVGVAPTSLGKIRALCR